MAIITLIYDRLCIGKEVVGVELNPLKSVHIVTPSQQLFVVPCFNHFSAHYFSPVELTLQKKKLLTDGTDNSWETVCVFFLKFSSLQVVLDYSISLQIDLAAKTYVNWSFADYKGIAIRNPKSGEYRCGAIKFNGTCLLPKWSLYSFFIIEGKTRQ